MVGFTDLSDTDESLIDEIISQAKDACVLDQITAINCSSFTDSVLPTHLETRFRNLKSFPPNKPNHPPPSFTKAHTFSSSHSPTNDNTHLGTHKSPNFSPSKKDPLQKTCFDPQFPNGSVTSPSKSLDSSPVVMKRNYSNEKNGLKEKSKLGSVSPGSGSDESSISSLFKPNPEEEKEKRRKQKPKSGSLSSPLSNSNSFMSSPSPPRKLGCFWCSPKKESSSKKKKKSKENWWDKSDEEFLSDLGSFSSKKQQKILKEAMKEEEKISIEAEKIVQWAKQASARMNVLDIDDELSDH
ncbi:hypothetical protein RIF29_36609 [Crotalaria pallida]|uniref:Uncharacterized protein n=1 Tax=Crotalaria pallida TaxID=3830 RepID=A0AAN9EBA2_CROPI